MIGRAVLEANQRNRRSVWSVNTLPLSMPHAATFPPALVRPCILASTRPGDTILDPFFGSGTVGLVCEETGRNYLGIELHPDYVKLAAERLGAPITQVVKVA